MFCSPFSISYFKFALNLKSAALSRFIIMLADANFGVSDVMREIKD